MIVRGGKMEKKKCPICGKQVTEYMFQDHHLRDDLFIPKDKYPSVKMCANCHKKRTIQQRKSWGWRRKVLTIVEEEEEPCDICGHIGVEMAHIIPKSKGGSDAVNNILFLCPNHHKAFDYDPKLKEFIQKITDNYQREVDGKFVVLQLKNDPSLRDRM